MASDTGTDPERTRRGGSRRGLLLLGGAMAGVAALPMLRARFGGAPARRPHSRLAGFHVVDGGPVSARPDPFAGIADPALDRPAPDVPATPCAGLFRAPTAPGTVPVAVFTDIDCPYCRRLEGRLADIGSGAITPSWHDLPLLGPASVIGARLIVAADAQGAEARMRDLLQRRRVTGAGAFIDSVARSLDLDAARLAADMRAPATEARLARTLGLANLFRVPGTPALVVADTLVIGDRPTEDIAALLADAADRRDQWPCGA